MAPAVLPPLPDDYTALEPHIDEQTMRIHHDKHHGAYVTNLDTALESQPSLQALVPPHLIPTRCRKRGFARRSGTTAADTGTTCRSGSS